MKFPKPRELKNNNYPDLQEDEPTLLKNLIQLARPSDGSHIDMYLDSTIKYVKEKQRKKANEVRLNNAAFGNNLYFVDITFPPSTEKFKALVDTGASNSLIQNSATQIKNLRFCST